MNIGLNSKNEFCAALKHDLSVPFVVMRRDGGDFTVQETGVNNVTFYGGSDACQGDSGGPL